jgi:hypothetical protein
MKKPIAAVLAVLVSLLAAAPAGADELSDLHARILEDPGNTALNLQYAAAAERAGKPRLALAAYERVLLNDSGNAAAQEGIKRVMRQLLGAQTRWVASVGIGWESNPANVAFFEEDSAIALGSIAMHDDRYWGNTAWQTDALAQVNIIFNNDNLNYGFLGIETGPVFDTGSWFTVHPALAVSTSHFDHSNFYNEAMGSVTLEGVTGGANQVVRFKAGFRDYGSRFTSDSGWFAQANARWSIPHIFGPHDVVVFSPWIRWSDIEGGVPITINDEAAPGRYWEYAADIAYYTPLSDWMVLGVNLTVAQRDYRDPGLFSGGDDRSDTLVAPGATLIFKHVFSYQTDLRLSYRHKDNDSNDKFREYEDDIVTLNIDTRF